MVQVQMFGNECPSCLDPVYPTSSEEPRYVEANVITPGEKGGAFTPPCGHSFHVHCQQEWMANAPELICMTCREPIDPTTIPPRSITDILFSPIAELPQNPLVTGVSALSYVGRITTCLALSSLFGLSRGAFSQTTLAMVLAVPNELLLGIIASSLHIPPFASDEAHRQWLHTFSTTQVVGSLCIALALSLVQRQSPPSGSLPTALALQSLASLGASLALLWSTQHFEEARQLTERLGQMLERGSIPIKIFVALPYRIVTNFTELRRNFQTPPMELETAP